MTAATSVLLVDDDDLICKAYRRILGEAGYDVVTAPGAEDALSVLKQQRFDVIVSDIHMPGLGGIELLRSIRTRDQDVPVILVTAAPGANTAMQALESGACRYLTKPLEKGALVEAVARAARSRRLADDRPGLDERALLEARFERALTRLWIAFQPIVWSKRRQVQGYEALVRTDEPLMSTPEPLLKAAEGLGRMAELGRAIRGRIAAAARSAPAGVLYVNIHPAELMDPELSRPTDPLAPMAANVVLEVTERAPPGVVADLAPRVAALRARGYRLAIDDLGAGYAGLSSFAILEPEVAKVDMSLVRGIDASPLQQTTVRSLITLCGELNVTVVAEGVETAAERATLEALGADLMQGYLFARPDRGFPTPLW